MLPCLALSIIKQRSKVKWGNPGKGVAPTTTPQLLKKEHSGHTQLWSPTLLTLLILFTKDFLSYLKPYYSVQTGDYY